MPETTPPTEEMFLLVYCFIDDLYQVLVPDRIKYRLGHEAMGMSDSEVITLSIMQEAHSNDSESSFHRLVAKDHPSLFPTLLERSRYHRRRKALLGVQLHLLRHLMHLIKVMAAWFIVDSAPVATAGFARSQSAKTSIPEATYGYCAAKKRYFFGFRLHLLISERGGLCDFVLSPAHVGERAVAEHMLGRLSERIVLADNGYSGAWLSHVLGRHYVGLWYGPRQSACPASKAAARLRRWQRAKRDLVETVFSMLADEFKMETTRARSLLGVKVRAVAKMLAYNVSWLLNELLGRPALAIKSLHM